MTTIPSYLVRSRHGVYYFRLTKKINGKQIARKVSLRTTSLALAKGLAVKILADIGMENGAVDRFKKFEIGFSSGTFTVKTDPSIPDDVEKLSRFLADNQELLQSLVASTAAAQPAQQQPLAVAPSVVNQYSSTFRSVMDKYEKRKEKELAKKTVYQYLRAIIKFKEWAESREGLNPLLMYHADKKLLSQYVDYLQSTSYKNKTIEDKHLAPLNTFFDFAISIGEYEDIPSPARGHKLKATKEELAQKVIREPYTEDELNLIFNYDLLKDNGNPCFYWLPILALYTGARINELAQLTILDISKIGDIDVIHITDENGGKLKNNASRRAIPLHPQVIQLGFLDYVNDVRKYGHQIFPNLIKDPFGSYGKEPSRRYAHYLDKIGITSPSKVFHSFRTTANNHLKQRGVPVEERNDMIGHENEGTNEKHYTQKYDVKYLYENVLPKLDYKVDFSNFVYEKDMFHVFIVKRMRNLREREKREKQKGAK